jgi:uncharacterized membrane protein
LIEKLIIGTHIVAGSISLLTGLLAIILGKKGDNTHKKIGIVFFYAMLVVFLSSWIVFVFIRPNVFLFVISVFSFYLCFSGYFVLKRKKIGLEKWYDIAAAWFALIIGALGIIYGAIYLYQKMNFIMAGLVIGFSYFTFSFGLRDVRFYMKPPQQLDKMWWWYYHMQSMIGGFIAAFTAFAVQNADKVLPNNMSWIMWVLPAAVGVPLSSWWANKYRKKFNKSA